MLSKKVQGSGMLTVATCIDRGRVGERLQAALAGLQELHFLKEKQADMVHWALRMDRETTDACQSNTTPVYAEEQRLEATLCALKQQLTRLRRQDVGLKTHLQQLDQQISELKLDVCKASTEHLESDSRPSSGFYELSDGGSGSLSNSCTSVYSACLSSSSQSNLQAFAAPAPLVMDDSRRRSADETAAHPDPPRGSGIRLGSSQIRTGMPSVERGRQRPVSTGDLERLLTPGVGYLRPSEVRTSSLSNNMRTNAHVDMKYQNNLVSRGGTEVYLYPSPLHAVALQSPIFYLGSCPSASLPSENRDPQEGTVASGSAGAARPESAQARPVGYISKLLQRSTSRLNVLVENAAPPMGPVSTCTPHALTTGAQDSERNQTAKIQTPIFFEESTMLSNNHLDGNKDSRMDFKHSVGNCGSLGRSVSCSTEKPNQIRHSDPQTSGPSKMASKAEMAGGSLAMANLCERSGQETRKRSSSKPPERRPKVSTASEESNAVPSEFVHAQFVPAGSQHVKIREQADRKTKAVRLRRRSCDKQRGSKQLQKLSARDREREATAKLRLERNSKALARHSASEFSVHGHPPLCCPGGAATKCDKTFTFYQPSSEHLHPEQYGGKRRQHHPQKQPSSSASEVRLTQSASYTQRPRDVPVQGSGRRSGTRPQSGHWGGAVATATRPVLRPSVSTTSYFSQMDVRYPPAPHRRHAVPRCESELSEYSAECASLFHSTLAGSSEGELSDYTTNRFGDSESSQGSQSHYDSDSSLSLYEDQLDGGEGEDEGDEGGLVWPEAALGPTAAGLPLSQASRSQPLACRIKASRALKKKIRRFQPASLKVMTLV